MPELRHRGLPVSELRPVRVPGADALLNGLGCALGLAASGASGLRFLARSENWWLPLKLGYRKAQLRRHSANPREWIVSADSGLLQPLVSFAAEHNQRLEPVPVAQVLDLFAPPSIVIHLKASVSVALDRYCDREDHRLEPGARNKLFKQFTEAENVCEVLLDACRRVGSAIVVVDAQDSRSEAAADQTAAAIQRQIGQTQK